MSKVYIKVWPRPMGVEPTIFTEKPVLPEPEIIITEDGEIITSPWDPAHVRIIEFESELEARRWVKEYYPMCYEEFGAE